MRRRVGSRVIGRLFITHACASAVRLIDNIWYALHASKSGGVTLVRRLVPITAFLTSAADAFGNRDHSKAPVTNGAAKLVPVWDDTSPSGPSVITFSPGAPSPLLPMEPPRLGVCRGSPISAIANDWDNPDDESSGYFASFCHCRGSAQPDSSRSMPVHDRMRAVVLLLAVAAGERRFESRRALRSTAPGRAIGGLPRARVDWSRFSRSRLRVTPPCGQYILTSSRVTLVEYLVHYRRFDRV